MDKTVRRGAGLALALGMLAGCAGPATKDGGDASTPPRAPGAARAFLLDSCPLDPAIGKESILLPVLLAPLIKSAAASAIDAGYDYFLKVMSERQRQLTASSTFQATGSFYALEKPSAGQQGEFYRMPLKCLVLVREADTEPALSPELREVWDINKEKINGALAIAKAGYALQRAPTFYAELKIRYLTLTVPAQALQDETGKPLLDRAGKAVVLPEPMDVPIEFEVKPVRVFYGQSGALRNPGDKKRLTLSVDLSAKAFENQKWTSTALLAKTFDLGMARAGDFIPESELAEKAGAVAPIPAPGQMKLRVPYGKGNAYAHAPDLVGTTATAILTESEDGSDIERWLYEKAKEKRDTLTGKAKGWVNDSVDRNTAKE